MAARICPGSGSARRTECGSRRSCSSRPGGHGRAVLRAVHGSLPRRRDPGARRPRRRAAPVERPRLLCARAQPAPHRRHRAPGARGDAPRHAGGAPGAPGHRPVHRRRHRRPGPRRRAPILDGNVKRVLARRHRVPGPVSSSATLGELWRLAELHTPETAPRTTRRPSWTWAQRLPPPAPALRRLSGARRLPGLRRGRPERYPEAALRRRRRLARRRFFVLVDPDGALSCGASAAHRHLGRPLVAARSRRPRDG